MRVSNACGTAQFVENIVFSCLGPKGAFQIIRPSESSFVVTVSSVASRILSAQLGPPPRISRLFLDLAAAQCSQVGDGGLWAVAFASQLLRVSNDLCREGVSSNVIATANLTALQWCVDFLEGNTTRTHYGPYQSEDRQSAPAGPFAPPPCERCPCRVNLNFDNYDVMMTLVRSIIGAKTGCNLCREELKYVCTMVLQGFLNSLSSNTNSREDITHEFRNKTPQFSYIMLCGPATMESVLLRNALLLDLPSCILQVMPSIVTSIDSVVVAMYSVSISYYSDGIAAPNAVIEIPNVKNMDKKNRSRKAKMLIDIGRVLVSLGVGLVVSQKVIDPLLKRFLIDNGVVPLERLSAQLIDSVRSLSGARILSTWYTGAHCHNCAISPPTTADLGYIHTLRVRSIFGKQYLQLSKTPSRSPSGEMAAVSHGYFRNVRKKCALWPAQSVFFENALANSIYRGTPVHTLVLCSPFQHSLNELRLSVNSAFSVLNNLLKKDFPAVVAGGGCTDLHLADLVKHIAQSEPQLQSFTKNSQKRWKKKAFLNFANCLEAVVSALDVGSPNRTTGRTQLIDKLHRANSATLQCADFQKSQNDVVCMFGWNPLERQPQCVLSYKRRNVMDVADDGYNAQTLTAVVVDSLPVKLHALHTAVGVANTLLRVTSTVNS